MKKSSWHAKWYKKHINGINYPTSIYSYVWDFVSFCFFKLFLYCLITYCFIFFVYGWWLFFTDYHLKYHKSENFWIVSAVLVWAFSIITGIALIVALILRYFYKKIKKRITKPIVWKD